MEFEKIKSNESSNKKIDKSKTESKIEQPLKRRNNLIDIDEESSCEEKKSIVTGKDRKETVLTNEPNIIKNVAIMGEALQIEGKKLTEAEQLKAKEEKRLKTWILLRCSPEWREKFNIVSGKARQTAKCWSDLALQIGPDIKGTEIQKEYNYLILQFKKHLTIAKRSGESGVKWKWFKILKPLLGSDPSINPVSVIDTSESPKSPDVSKENLVSTDNSMIESPNCNTSKKKKIDTKLDPILELLKSSMEQKNELFKIIGGLYKEKTTKT